VASSNYKIWTSSPSPYSGNAIRVDFYDGEATYQPLAQLDAARCVRGASCDPSPRFVSDGGVVFDRATNLNWQAAWPTPSDWTGALATCRALGAGWRLATVHELATLLDYSLPAPVIDTGVFTLQSSTATVDPRFDGNTAW